MVWVAVVANGLFRIQDCVIFNARARHFRNGQNGLNYLNAKKSCDRWFPCYEGPINKRKGGVPAAPHRTRSRWFTGGGARVVLLSFYYIEKESTKKPFRVCSEIDPSISGAESARQAPRLQTRLCMLTSSIRWQLRHGRPLDGANW